MRYVNDKLEFVVPKGIINYNNASNKTLASKGYYRVVILPFDENTQKLENLHIVGNVATYDVIDLSQQEIEQKEQQKQLEQINALNEKWKQDGQTYYDEIKNQITLSLVGKTNAINIMSEINKTVYPLLNKIKEGDWPLAVIDYMDNENNPTIQEVIDLFNQVGQKAVEYYQTEYPH